MRPEWTCTCGRKSNDNFCPHCGRSHRISVEQYPEEIWVFPESRWTPPTKGVWERNPSENGARYIRADKVKAWDKTTITEVSNPEDLKWSNPCE
jgi:hypothetical protein